MNKEEVKDLFEEPLKELDAFAEEIQTIKNLINLIIENFDLLKEDVTDEQIGEVSSEINIKVGKIISIIKDILADSKKLESFINEIKLLKRKRDNKLNKNKTKIKDNFFEELLKELDRLKKYKKEKEEWEPYKHPFGPYSPSKKPDWISPSKNPDWKIKF